MLKKVPDRDSTMKGIFVSNRRLIVLIFLGISALVSSCAYLEGAARQSGYSRIQTTDPSLRNLKHMIDRQTFFVYGRLLDENKPRSRRSVAVLAYSSRFEDNELVDSTHIVHTGTQYALHLPAGQYELIVLSDEDQNNVLNETEVVGRIRIALSVESYPDMVVSDVDIRLREQQAVGWDVSLAVPEIAHLQESLFFPKGSIRSLDDPLFDPDIATLGMYEPGAFLEISPAMFYALEEDSYKTPVIFVHGIGGSARDFKSIVDGLDRDQFKPWFFYYPSGSDLDQLADIFYDIFLSGKAAPHRPKPTVIIAHSMGGLVAREVLNRYRGTDSENQVGLLITIASPLGGHPAAAAGEKHGALVLPSWRNLNPDSPFIEQLFRKPLPSTASHHLLYAYGDPGSLKLGENSDGVVPISSQLRPAAQQQATSQYGFNNSHVGVLNDESVVQYILDAMSRVDGLFPESHLKVLTAGGFDVELDDTYSATEKYFLRVRGKYLASLASGKLDSLGDPLLEHFVKASQRKIEAESDAETAWLKFSSDYPQLAATP